MRYKDQLYIKLYSCSSEGVFTLQAIIDDYQEISFTHSLYEAGDFTIQINYNIPNAQLFQRGMFVQFGNDSRMFGEILTVTDSIGSDGKGSQTRVITGKDARYIFKRRIISNLNNEGNWIMTAKGELCMRNLVLDQCGDNAEQKRKLPVNNLMPDVTDAIGSDYSVSEAYSNLYDVLVTIATQTEIGWAVVFNGSSLSLECFQGENKVNEVIFSTDFESLSNGTYSDTSDNYLNSVYIGGKGTGADRDIYEGEDMTTGESPAGLARFEAWDNQSSMTSESEYEAEAESVLTQFMQNIEVSGNGLAECPYRFKEQYDIGDKITIAFSGKSAWVKIITVTEHWSFCNYGLTFSFGKPLNGLDRQLQLMLKQIQKASDKTESTSSVKYYTIPTDTEQPKADVIYNTIGFTGDVGSGATFTLYYDTEKTGAKNYHIWFKQLGGSGKLTLTTGVSGKANLTLNAGTYVAIIYVDAEGNVLSQGATPTTTIASGNTQPAESGAVAGAISSAVSAEAGARNTAIENAVNALDVAEVGGSGKYISAISETDGKINATSGNIDSDVTLNSANPITSGAVADIMSALPTDAVLHYSFDEVPDYPDGTADVRLIDNNTYQIQNTNYQFRQNNNGATFSNVNGNLQVNITSTASYVGAFIQAGYVYQKIVKLKIKVTALSGKLHIFYGSTVIKDITSIGTYEICTYVSTNNGLYFDGGGNANSCTFTVEQIYIGNGSYSTPVIDNANGQNNAINNGGIAVKGVSGKGAGFVSANQKLTIPVSEFSAPTSNDNISISLWLNVPNDYVADNQNCYKGIVSIGSYAGGFGLARNINSIVAFARDSTYTRVYSVTMNKGSWHNYVIVYSGTSHTFSVYVDGVKAGETQANISDYQFGSNASNWVVWGNTLMGGSASTTTAQPANIDDLLIFDRALSDKEILALYLNNANTPKYYNLNTYQLARKLPPPPTADGVYTLQCTVSSGVETYTWIGGTRSTPTEPEENTKGGNEENSEENEEEIKEEPAEPEENVR